MTCATKRKYDMVTKVMGLKALRNPDWYDSSGKRIKESRRQEPQAGRRNKNKNKEIIK